MCASAKHGESGNEEGRQWHREIMARRGRGVNVTWRQPLQDDDDEFDSNSCYVQEWNTERRQEAQGEKRRGKRWKRALNRSGLHLMLPKSTQRHRRVLPDSRSELASTASDYGRGSWQGGGKGARTESS
ncbi:hypothetical protein cyc_07533 [Cyclospora cayetanensis]|uniref:Uncharacterized protein n=1 Tax=Cyclospora cayetanensis TaxID=88456 RepID=A0A1D3D8C0_9EIME|nr:hypothetical protein cyc_07533 [Cyclospora cayetanensis]